MEIQVSVQRDEKLDLTEAQIKTLMDKLSIQLVDTAEGPRAEASAAGSLVKAVVEEIEVVPKTR